MCALVYEIWHLQGCIMNGQTNVLTDRHWSSLAQLFSSANNENKNNMRWRAVPLLTAYQSCHMSKGILVKTGSGNGLVPVWHQAIIWNNTNILSTGPLDTNFDEILIHNIIIFIQKMQLKMLSAKCQPFCSGFICWIIFSLTSTCQILISAEQ